MGEDPTSAHFSTKVARSRMALQQLQASQTLSNVATHLQQQANLLAGVGGAGLGGLGAAGVGGLGGIASGQGGAAGGGGGFNYRYRDRYHHRRYPHHYRPYHPHHGYYPHAPYHHYPYADCYDDYPSGGPGSYPPNYNPNLQRQQQGNNYAPYGPGYPPQGSGYPYDPNHGHGGYPPPYAYPQYPYNPYTPYYPFLGQLGHGHLPFAGTALTGLSTLLSSFRGNQLSNVAATVINTIMPFFKNPMIILGALVFVAVIFAFEFFIFRNRRGVSLLPRLRLAALRNRLLQQQLLAAQLEERRLGSSEKFAGGDAHHHPPLPPPLLGPKDKSLLDKTLKLGIFSEAVNLAAGKMFALMGLTGLKNGLLGGGSKPANQTMMPAGEDNKPANQTMMPAGEDNKPANQAAMPADGAARPPSAMPTALPAAATAGMSSPPMQMSTIAPMPPAAAATPMNPAAAAQAPAMAAMVAGDTAAMAIMQAAMAVPTPPAMSTPAAPAAPAAPASPPSAEAREEYRDGPAEKTPEPSVDPPEAPSVEPPPAELLTEANPRLHFFRTRPIPTNFNSISSPAAANSFSNSGDEGKLLHEIQDLYKSLTMLVTNLDISNELEEMRVQSNRLNAPKGTRDIRSLMNLPNRSQLM